VRTKLQSDSESEHAPPKRESSTSLGEIGRLFLKLGTTAFGGPAAHIAMMEDEVVRRRRWLSREQFVDYLGATNLIPGPNSTELAIHIGHARAGRAGLVVAGACFILPAALIVGAIAWVYVRFGTLPAAAGLLYGVKPVVIAVVVQALWRFAHSAVKTRTLAAIGLAAIGAVAFGVNELLVLAAAGIAAALTEVRELKTETRLLVGTTLPIVPASVSVAAVATASQSVALWPLFGVFAKIGAVLFGSGYVLLAFLRTDLVERLHWITEQQLLDAVAVGQITPGPVFTTATFVGYLVAGAPGAVVATLGIFLPAFVFVTISGPIVPRLRRSRWAGAVLDGVNVASLALMAVVSFQLARSALIDPLTIAIAAVSGVTLWRTRVNSAWLVAAGAFIGLLAAR
jgi:chromate transporter